MPFISSFCCYATATVSLSWLLLYSFEGAVLSSPGRAPTSFCFLKMSGELCCKLSGQVFTAEQAAVHALRWRVVLHLPCRLTGGTFPAWFLFSEREGQSRVSWSATCLVELRLCLLLSWQLLQGVRDLPMALPRGASRCCVPGGASTRARFQLPPSRSARRNPLD